MLKSPKIAGHPFVQAAILVYPALLGDFFWRGTKFIRAAHQEGERPYMVPQRTDRPSRKTSGPLLFPKPKPLGGRPPKIGVPFFAVIPFWVGRSTYIDVNKPLVQENVKSEHLVRRRARSEMAQNRPIANKVPKRPKIGVLTLFCTLLFKSDFHEFRS